MVSISTCMYFRKRQRRTWYISPPAKYWASVFNQSENHNVNTGFWTSNKNVRHEYLESLNNLGTYFK